VQRIGRQEAVLRDPSASEDAQAEARLEIAGRMYRELRKEFPESAKEESQRERCADCDACARHAYSDATTPGFFFDKCEKHREGG
jgi:hypothetical protein